MRERRMGMTATERRKAVVRERWQAKAGRRRDLAAHVAERHSRITSEHGGKIPARWTAGDLAKAHAETHWRYGSPNHYHLAPGEQPVTVAARPAGWYSGLDVVDTEVGS